jgi:hypothetical protein
MTSSGATKSMTGEGFMRTALSVIAATAMLAGCSGGGAAQHRSATPSVRTTPTTSPPRTGPLTTGAGVLPGEKPPVEPAIAKTHTDNGAFAFAAYFIRALSWSIQTTDPYLLTQLSATSCEACLRYRDSLNAASARGNRLAGYLEVQRIELARGTYRTKADHAFRLVLKEVAQTVAASGVRSTRTSRVYDSILFLTWSVGGWKVVGQGAP